MTTVETATEITAEAPRLNRGVPWWRRWSATLLYVVVALAAGVRLRWPMWALLVAVLAAIPPLVTLPLEYWFRRRGLLSQVVIARNPGPELTGKA